MTESIHKLDILHNEPVDNDEYYACMSTYNTDGKTYFYITINPEEATTGAYAHEALHFVYRLFHFIGVKYSIDNQEVYTYLLEYLLDKILEKAEDYKAKLPSNT